MKRRWRLAAGGLAAVLAVAALALGLSGEWPAWHQGGTRALPMPLIGHDAGTVLCPVAGGVVELRGDSHVAGARMAHGGQPFGAVLQAQLASSATVISRGAGGDTAQTGEARWPARLLRGDVVLLAYGTNDAAPRGWLSRRRPVPVSAFAGAIRQQVLSLRAQGAAVALIAPPPGGSAAINRRLAPYRAETRRLGRELGISVFDPAAAFAACDNRQPLLGRDALHLTQAGHQCLGQWLARQLCPKALP